MMFVEYSSFYAALVEPVVALIRHGVVVQSFVQFKHEYVRGNGKNHRACVVFLYQRSKEPFTLDCIIIFSVHWLLICSINLLLTTHHMLTKIWLSWSGLPR